MYNTVEISVLLIIILQLRENGPMLVAYNMLETNLIKYSLIRIL